MTSKLLDAEIKLHGVGAAEFDAAPKARDLASANASFDGSAALRRARLRSRCVRRNASSNFFCACAHEITVNV